MFKKNSVFKKTIEKLASNNFHDIYPSILLMKQLEDSEKISECMKVAISGKDEDYLRIFSMYLSAVGQQMQEKVDLDLSTIDLPPEIGFLRFLPRLESLNLGYFRNLEDLSPLEALENLTSLQLGGDSIESIKPLAKLLRLETLHLSNCDVLSNIAPLESLQNLEVLSMYSCYRVTRLDSLAKLSNLRDLTFYGCSGIRKLDSIQSLAKLKKLEIISCDKVVNLEPLSKLFEMEVLKLSFCESIVDIEPICRLSKLTELDVANCKRILDFSPIGYLTPLLKLDLSNNNLNDLSFLEPLKNLTELKIFNTCPADLAPLYKLESLQSLEISSYHWDEKSNFDFIAGMPHLKKFDFESKKEKSPQIDAIPHSASLESFSFNGSRSEFNYERINSFPNLKSLTLRSTKLEGSAAELLKNEFLEEITINACADLGEFAELIKHPKLKVVEFIYCLPSDVEIIKTLNSKIDFRF